MLRFVLNVLLLRRLIASRSLRRAVVLGFGLLFLIVTIYTVNLVLTLPERTSGHAHTNSIR
jgi:hypothetical protein